MDNCIRITVAAPDGDGASAESGVIRKYGVGRKCRGKVVNFKPYGFFVETDDGGFGLVHGKNVKGWNWDWRFDRVFRHGSEIDVTVIDFEEKTNRMSFSCELPEGAGETQEAEPEPDAPRLSVAETRRENAEKWAAENPELSQRAFEWLKTELEDGPLYGPLTTILCDRFQVPVPVSQWILLFPEFACYSGKGDNPRDLPAVALGARAGEVAYWDHIKVRTDELLEFRNRGEDDSMRFGALADRLNRAGAFPGAKWIRDYMTASRGLALGKSVYGVADTAERLVIPLLGQLGWDVSAGNAAFVRGGGSTFSIRLFGGTASSGNVSLAVKCAPAGTSFASLRGVDPSAGDNVVEQVLGLFNQIGGDEPESAKVVWTDGTEWVVFTRELLTECIGVLADHRGTALLDELAASDDGRRFRRVAFPTEASPFEWLAAFADLHDLIGKA